ncbi:MAG: crossover junction endodeoxyribonuclease RuvC [Chitinophagaceae bacterium]|nr:crossover junction endodeoxyribonuclease RuvC [Chitinophagaceae bacterium]
MEKSPKIILGIDPGTLLMGYCIIHVNGDTLKMVEMNVLKLKSTQDNYSRLQTIYNKVDELITHFRPHCFAIEAPFFGKNVQSMLKLGRAQGVAIAAAIASGLEVCEYSPRKIKQSITGNGNADKEQVWKMLQHIMALQEFSLDYYDASDALAVAVCHHFQDKPQLKTSIKKTKSWKEFIALNPDKVK